MCQHIDGIIKMPSMCCITIYSTYSPHMFNNIQYLSFRKAFELNCTVYSLKNLTFVVAVLYNTGFSMKK